LSDIPGHLQAKVTPVLWTQKRNKKGLSPIYLRIEANDRRRYVSLRTFIRDSHWNDKARRVRKSHPQCNEINNLISQRIAEAESEIVKLHTEREAVTTEVLKEVLTPEPLKDDTDFFVFADSIVDDLERRGKLYTHKRYKSICKKFKDFCGPTLPFEEITPKLLRDYETHLINKFNNKPSTVASNFIAIRAILYRAIKEGKFQQGINPFFQFKISRGKTKRDKLNLSELQAIEALRLVEGSLIWHVRNYFLFSFYCAGIRFGDVAKLKHSNIVRDGDIMRLSYEMSKTGATKTIKLLDQATAILAEYVIEEAGSNDSYLFPILQRYDTSTPKKLLNAISAQNTLVNKYLKKIAQQAGIPCKLSFHVSRHSFADIARQKGWGVYLISKALGHSSIKVTESYLKGFDTGALDEQMDQLFG